MSAGKTTIRYKKNTIVAYRIQDSGYCHPECIDNDWPGQGEVIFASDLTLEADGNLYFPGEYHNEYTDRTVDNICCLSCGLWFNDDDHLAGVESVVNKQNVRADSFFH